MSRPISWYILGVMALLAGIFALLNPIAATLAVETIAGASFLAIGLLQAIFAFREDGWKARLWSLIIALAFIALGVMLLSNPIAGAASLTIMVAAMLFIAGVAKFFMALTFDRNEAYWAVLLSGVLSVILAMMIMFNMPASIAVTLGVIFAVELISNGISMILVGRQISKGRI